jgi:hypothetical protein
MRSLVTTWLIAIVALANLPPLQDAPPITVEAYWQLVRSTRQSIVEMEALPATEIRNRLDELAGEWKKVTAVEFPDGRVQRINSTRLITDLETDPPNLEHLLALTDALLAAHEQAPQDVFTPEDVEPLREILARPEFQWDEGHTLEMPAWLQQIYDWIAGLFERWLFRIGNAVYRGRTLLMIAAALCFILAVYFISRNLARNLVREAQLAAEGQGDAALTSRGALQRAQTLSNAGDYRNAIRYLYLSSLLVLDERGLLRYDRSRTNREYLRSVASQPDLEGPLHNVIDVFDSVWYGFEQVDETAYRSYVKQVEALQEKHE